MQYIPRPELESALEKFRYDKRAEVSATTRAEILRLLTDSLSNSTHSRSGTGQRPVYRRAYQASFEADSPKRREQNDVTMRAVELRSFLRLDLDDGGPLISQSDGLIITAREVAPSLMERLDDLAIADAAEVSDKFDIPTRVKIPNSTALTSVSGALENWPNALLIGEIRPSSKKTMPDKAVDTAAALRDLGARFALSTVTDEVVLARYLDRFRLSRLTPESIDIDQHLTRHLDPNHIQFEAMAQKVGAILTVSRENFPGVPVTVLGADESVRRALFAVAELFRFDSSDIRISARDMMPETILNDSLPEARIERSSGAVLSI